MVETHRDLEHSLGLVHLLGLCIFTGTWNTRMKFVNSWGAWEHVYHPLFLFFFWTWIFWTLEFLNVELHLSKLLGIWDVISIMVIVYL
jgi:hypothetical protein